MKLDLCSTARSGDRFDEIARADPFKTKNWIKLELKRNFAEVRAKREIRHFFRDLQMPSQKNKEKVIAALLATTTIRAAAVESGLSEATLYGYLRDEEFKKEYREARRATVEVMIGRIQSLGSKAADVLERNLDCENAAVETRSAQIIIEQSIQGVKDQDLLERVEMLEQYANGTTD